MSRVQGQPRLTPKGRDSAWKWRKREGRGKERGRKNNRRDEGRKERRKRREMRKGKKGKKWRGKKRR